LTQTTAGMAVILILTSASIVAAPPEGEVFFPGERSFGVQVHTLGNGKDLAALGANWVRLDFSWAGTETGQRGHYDFAAFEEKVEHYRSNGINVLGLLAWHYYCGDLYPNPESDEDFAVAVEGYASFAQAAANHLKGKVKIWELGNEPECFAVGKVNDPQRYTKLARAAAKAIREVDREVVVGACSCAWMDRDFLSRCMSAGLLADGTINAITFHGYHRADIKAESGLREDVGWLRELIRKHSPPGVNVIVVDSERGYAQVPFLSPKPWESWRNLVYTEAEQAAYLARHYLEEISLGVEVSVWYKDMSGESNYSLYEGGPGSRIRPMGHVMRNLASLLNANPKEMVNDGYTVSLADLPDKLGDPNVTIPVRAYLKRDPNVLIIALWNPVEAFDGHILQSRQRIGGNYYEAWRAISPEDFVEVPLKVNISPLSSDQVESACRYNLTAAEDKDLRQAIELDFAGGQAITPEIEAGPMPTLIVLNLR